MKSTYWTVFYYGSTLTKCSEHKTYEAAVRAIRKCERLGGASHMIMKVKILGRPK